MIQALKKKLKSEKGFTLIELLAVIVILGILAAIAIPSIMGIINNSKKDAQVANAQQMISSAKNAMASNDAAITWGTGANANTGTVTLGNLIDKGFLDEFNNPASNDAAYDTTNSKVVIQKTTGSNAVTYTVYLGTSTTHYYINGKTLDELDRSIVTNM